MNDGGEQGTNPPPSLHLVVASACRQRTILSFTCFVDSLYLPLIIYVFCGPPECFGKSESPVVCLQY